MEADTLGCIIFLLGAVVPRVLVLAAWHNDQAAWQAAFGSPIWPVLGFLLLPWTTFAFVLMQAGGGIEGLEWLWLLLAVVADVGTWGGGALGNRERVSTFKY